MKISSKLSFNKPAVKIPAIAQQSLLYAIIVNLVIIILAVAYYLMAQPQLPIFYSLAQPDQQLANKYWLFIFPVFSLLINFLHAVMLVIIKKYEDVLLQLFAAFTVIIQLLLLLALVRIIYITW